MTKLYIVHGWTYSLDKWQQACQELQKNGIEPIMLRVPGLTEPSSDVWDINGYVEWLHEKIGSETAPFVLGHSNGGRILMAYNQKYPNHIARLILLDSAGVYQDQTLPRLKLLLLRSISKVGKTFAGLPGIRRVFYRLIGAQDYLNASPNMKLTMRNMLAADKQIQPELSKMPTLIIWGSDDTITPLQNGRKLLVKLPRAHLYVINGARHSPMATHTNEFVKQVKAFIEGDGQSGTV